MSNEHLGGSYAQGDGNTWMPDVWGYLVVRHQVSTVLDLGCGHGHAMQWFKTLSFHVIGVEGDPVAIKGHCLPAHVITHDYTTGPAPLGDSTFDLGWAAEFVEHVDECYQPNYMKDLQRCRVVCITHAEPGQNGHHHVTLKDDDWWISRFEKEGFAFEADQSATLRLTDRWRAGWGRRTLMVFHNQRVRRMPTPVFEKLVPIYDHPRKL